MTLPLLRPDWPVPARVRAACSMREGGVSKAPYDSLNLGDHVGDDGANVAENRRRFAAALDARPVFMKQVHRWHVAGLDDQAPDGLEADACVTASSKVACTIMVADCLPVLFADTGGRAVAAAHAGWRGLAGETGHGVLEAVWASFWPRIAESEAQARDRTRVWLGPCIGPAAFEVGDEVKQAFVGLDASAAGMFQARGSGKWLANLPGLARLRLQALGLNSLHGNDGTPGWCTVGNASRFFSHRRDRVSGRFAAAIWLD